jgi:hypothetical protein
MGPGIRDFGWTWPLAAAATIAMAACSSGDDEPGVTCRNAQGLWQVAIDYGNGLVQRQQWAVGQQGCELTLDGDPADTSSVGLDTGRGSMAGDGLYASWTKTVGACEIGSRLEATVGDERFSGTLIWVRSPYGQGYCPAASGQFAVTGQR